MAKEGTLGPGVPEPTIPKEKSNIEKFSVLLESRGVPEEEKGEWLRQNGLHSEHLILWVSQRSF